MLRQAVNRMVTGESNMETWKRKVSPVDMHILDDRRLLLVFDPIITGDCRFKGYAIRSLDNDGNVKMEFKQIFYPPVVGMDVCYSIDVPFIMLNTGEQCLVDLYTQEFLMLPDYNLSIDHDDCRDMLDIAACIGYITTTKEFKVIRVLNLSCFYHGLECDAIEPPGCEVLTVGTNNWQKVRSPPFFVHRRPISIKGVVYFFANHEKGVKASCVLAFDLEREEWIELPLPQSFLDSTHDKESYILAELKGLLCLVVMGPIGSKVHARIQLWLLKDVENLEWVNEYFCEVGRNVILPDGIDYIQPLDIEDDGRILMYHYSNKELFHYDPRDKSTKIFRKNVAINPGFYVDTRHMIDELS